MSSINSSPIGIGRRLLFLGRLLLIWVILFAVIGESLLRLLPESMVGQLGSDKMNVEFYDFGPWFTPNQKFRHVASCYSTYPISINSFGMRDRERELTKQPGVFRISVLGDSFMEALQVPDGQFTTSLMEERLHTDGVAAEVLNFGFSGYGTAQELFLYRRKVRQFRPDMVMIFFLPQNDIRNNSLELDFRAYGCDPKSFGSPSSSIHFAYFVRNGDALEERPNEVLNSQAKAFIKRYILYKSYLASFLYEKMLYLRSRLAIEEIRKAEEQVRLQASRSLPPSPAQPSADAVQPPAAPATDSKTIVAEIEEAWRMTELIFRQFAKETEADGAQLCVTIIPELETTSDGKLVASDRHRRIVALLNSLGIQHLDLAPLFIQQMEAEKMGTGDICSPCDGHWNARGHALAARFTEDWLMSGAFLSVKKP